MAISEFLTGWDGLNIICSINGKWDVINDEKRNAIFCIDLCAYGLTISSSRGIKILEGSGLDNFRKTIVCEVAEPMKLLHPSTHNTVHVVEDEILIRCVSSHHKALGLLGGCGGCCGD